MGNAAGGNHVRERPKRLKEGCVSVSREWTNMGDVNEGKKCVVDFFIRRHW